MSVKKFVIGSDIEFGGFRIKRLGDGIQMSPDLEKIEEVQAMVTPKTKNGVPEFLRLSRQLEACTP